MALTIDTTVNAMPANDKSADRLRRTYKVTGPASYVTGGVAFTPLEIGLGSRVHVLAGNVAITATGTACRLVAVNNADPAAPKMVWFDQAFAEIANGVDLSAYTVDVELIGQ